MFQKETPNGAFTKCDLGRLFYILKMLFPDHPISHSLLIDSLVWGHPISSTLTLLDYHSVVGLFNPQTLAAPLKRNIIFELL